MSYLSRNLSEPGAGTWAGHHAAQADSLLLRSLFVTALSSGSLLVTFFFPLSLTKREYQLSAYTLGSCFQCWAPQSLPLCPGWEPRGSWSLTKRNFRQQPF